MANTRSVGPRKSTIEYALRKYALTKPDLLARHPAAATMSRQMLGFTAASLGYMAIWPPALTIYSLLLPRMLDVPMCDLGRGLDPELRSLMMYVSSHKHGCAYCAAHSAGLGTLFSRPKHSRSKYKQANTSQACDMFSPREMAAINYANAAASRPAQVTDTHRNALSAHFTPVDEEALVLAVCVMGFLNNVMDTLGVVLEWGALEQAEVLEFDVPQRAYDPDVDAELSKSFVASDDGENVPPLKLISTIARLAAADIWEFRSTRILQSTLRKQVEQRLGYYPYYLDSIGRSSVRRSIAHILMQYLHASESSVTVPDRLTMMYAFSTANGNRTLATHAAYGAVRLGVPTAQLRVASDPVNAFQDGQFAATLALQCTQSPVVTSPELIDALTTRYSPEEIMELVVVLGICGILQRYTSTYPPDHWEPPIQRFVGRFGAEGLPLIDPRESLQT